jgi:hypothetical protein
MVDEIKAKTKGKGVFKILVSTLNNGKRKAENIIFLSWIKNLFIGAYKLINRAG